jgi:ceramide glucosyltransferase
MDAHEGCLLVLTGVSVGLYLTMVGSFLARMGRRTALPIPEHQPRVSILKPLAGIDDDLAANLASFANLDYAHYEVLLGVASREDAAFPLARQFVKDVGPLKAKLIITNPREATNPKVAQLLALERAATGEILVISDSNVHVAPDYLLPLVAELAQPRVAIASNIIAGTGEQTLGAALENLQLGAVVAPGVVACAHVAGRAITIGKSMAVSRRALWQIGGLARVAHLLSEDHMLGKAFAKAGFKVSISLVPVVNRNVTCSLQRTIERHTRWAKLRRAIEPLGFVLEPTLSPIVIASGACLVWPSKRLCFAFLVATFVQTAGAIVTTRVLRGEALKWYWAPLELIRSYLLFFCWVRACLSRRVSWRGHHFELAKGSAIVPAEPSVWSRVRTLVRA